MQLEKLTIKDTFKQWRDKINNIINDYDNVLVSDESGTLTIDDAHNNTSEVIINVPTKFTDTVTFGDGLMTIDPKEGYITGTVQYATQLKYTRKINDTDFNGSADIETNYWGKTRTFTISDITKKHKGTGTKVNGKSNVNLILPQTLDADITGNADTATKLQTSITINGTNFDGSQNITTNLWGPTRKISILNPDENYVDTTLVDGSQDFNLYLPKIISSDVSGTAEIANKLKTARLFDGISFDGSDNVFHYGTCATAADVQLKTVDCDGFELVEGAFINIYFDNENTAINPKLNVNNTSPSGIDIYKNDNIISTDAIKMRCVYTCLFDGRHFQIVGSSYEEGNPFISGTAHGNIDGNANTATTLQTVRNIDGIAFDGSSDIVRFSECPTAGSTQIKIVSCNNFELVNGSIVFVRFKNTNTVANPKLNVNDTGAKDIYNATGIIDKGELVANNIYTFIYDGKKYQLISTNDRNVENTLSTTTKAFITGTTTQTNNTGTQIFDSNVYLTSNTGELYAKNYVGETASFTGTITASAFNGIINGSVSSDMTAVTQSATDSSTKIATTAFVKNAYTTFEGATEAKDGSSGLVPTPTIADRNKFLKGDGTWVTVETEDTKVTQTVSVANGEFPLLLKNTSANTTITDTTKFASGFTFNPSKKTLTVTSTTITDTATIQKIVHDAPDDTSSYRFDVTNSNDKGFISIKAGSNTAAELILYGGDTISNGNFKITANSGSNSYNLVGSSDGTLTWDGSSFSATEIKGSLSSDTSAITQSASDSSTKIATTEFVKNATVNSATNATNVTGTIASSATATTQSVTDSSTKIATTEFVKNATVNSATNASILTGSINSGVTAVTESSTDSSTKVATTEFVKNAFSAVDAIVYKGTLAGSASGTVTMLPSANKGDLYKVSTAGYVGTNKVEVGDMLICNTDSTASETVSNWDIIQTNTDIFVGATSSANGTIGLVPAPTSGNQEKYLQANGTWTTPADTKVTAVENHYIPTSSTSKTANGGTDTNITNLSSGSGIQVLTGLNMDSAGHITDVKSIALRSVDTTYSIFTGATSSTDGTSGLVPVPSSDSQDKFLKGNGTWEEIKTTNLVYDTNILETTTKTVSLDVNSDDVTSLDVASDVVKLSFTQADKTKSARKLIYLTATADTTLSIENAEWANTEEEPEWGKTGYSILIEALFVGGRVILHVLDNNQISYNLN